MNEPLRALASAVDTEAPREDRARVAAEMICEARAYRWIGIYDIGDEEIALLAHTGEQPPVQPESAIDGGLSGEAVQTRATVVRDDEAVVPILGAESGIVIGTLNAESHSAGAFANDDVAFLEDCAALLRPLFD
jgi:putative methionine-R-sulfoxide reductase with GAF domain